ncbi:Maf1 regulator [Cylindrobasidium torrendii FP15055 ss-10]|uniref:Repressor of RNA polymerase III transcription MAF1 n=1 Tax=Cylindrobasidium torrendii FP15055 ss-10 TaxID=1314674 RepID=A0A0D7AZY7_9AGAR|nr:Maf1 regulator [Cylindrobasidium torrendii FP15055 ss-10]
MKYIENPSLARLASSLEYNGPECSVHTRIEAYSCKNIKRDKRLFKTLESAYAHEAENILPRPDANWKQGTPPKHNHTASSSPASPDWFTETPFGRFDQHSTRKILYLLISTLNIAYPDHDFSDVRPAQFSKASAGGAGILNALGTALSMGRYSAYPFDLFPKAQPTSSSPSVSISPMAPPPIRSGTHPALYSLLDEAIGPLTECEVYEYTPDVGTDPHADEDDEDEDDFFPQYDDSPTSDPEDVFQFDETDSNERDAADDSDEDRIGELLWSSHWFFLNKKQKRILYLSVWSKGKLSGWTAPSTERFLGWDGAVGAGARAMGISVH